MLLKSALIYLILAVLVNSNEIRKLKRFKREINSKASFTASFIQICSQSDPKLSACIRKSILALRPHLSDGIPEINVPSLNPLLVPEFSVLQESGINVQATFKNITIYGATNFRLRSVRSDVKSDKFRIKIWFPELIMKGEYAIQGTMLMMPINGNGMAYGNFCKYFQCLNQMR